MQSKFGYSEQPTDSNGISRAHTTGQIHSWDMPRIEKALEAFNSECGGLNYPGIYILLHGKDEAYVGEAGSLYNRIKQHMVPTEKWDRVIIINDGRPGSHSYFNDAIVLKELEYHTNRVLALNKYHQLSIGADQTLNTDQRQLVSVLTEEIDFLLKKKNIITKTIAASGEEEVFGDELKGIINKAGLKLGELSTYEAEINGLKAFIRPGSPKPRGWQITFRDIFLNALSKGDGFLLVPRDGVLLIPLAEVQKVIKDKNAYNQNTIDIWIVFGDDKITLSYKDETIDVTKYKLIGIK
jgi:hypothetical protein